MCVVPVWSNNMLHVSKKLNEFLKVDAPYELIFEINEHGEVVVRVN